MNLPDNEPDDTKCEGCNKPATHRDTEGIPLCKACWDELPESEPTPDSALSAFQQAAGKTGETPRTDSVDYQAQQIVTRKPFGASCADTINEIVALYSKHARNLESALAPAYACNADFASQLASLTADRDGLSTELKRVNQDLFYLQTRVMHAAGPAEAKSACSEMMRENYERDRMDLIADLRTALATATLELTDLRAAWNAREPQLLSAEREAEELKDQLTAALSQVEQMRGEAKVAAAVNHALSLRIAKLEGEK